MKLHKITSPILEDGDYRILDIMPYLPKRDCFFDSRQWTVGFTADVLPFAVTTRISANNQQWLLLYEETK